MASLKRWDTRLDTDNSRQTLLFLAIAAAVIAALVLVAWLVIARLDSPASRFEAWTGLDLPRNASVKNFRDSTTGPFGVDGDLAVCVDVDPETIQEWLATEAFAEHIAWRPGPVDPIMDLSGANIPAAVLQSAAIRYAEFEGPSDDYRILVADPQSTTAWLWAVWW